MTHQEAIAELAIAKLMQDDPVTIRYWAKELKDFTPKEVMGGVKAVIDSGQNYIHLGLLRKTVKDTKAKKYKDEVNRRQQEEHQAWKKQTTGIPPCWKLQMEYLSLEDPTDEDKQVVLDSIREEMLKHPHGTEMYDLWMVAGKTWKAVRV